MCVYNIIIVCSNNRFIDFKLDFKSFEKKNYINVIFYYNYYLLDVQIRIIV